VTCVVEVEGFDEVRQFFASPAVNFLWILLANLNREQREDVLVSTL
jgi:hypothetical protein